MSYTAAEAAISNSSSSQSDAPNRSPRRQLGIKIAILDDYQGVALTSADWGPVGDPATIHVLRLHIGSTDELVAALRGYEVVVAMRERTRFPASVLERLPDLRLLVSTGPRNAAIDMERARALGITVSFTRILDTPTAELTWALILALARNTIQEDGRLRAGRWQTTLGTDLAGSTLALLGLGRQGGQVARIATAFGMSIIAWSEHLSAERAREVGATLVTQDALFERADFLSIHVVLSRRTRGLVDAARLRSMKPSAFLVNTSRGPIVDEGALVAALSVRSIAGAGLDVFATEPLPADHPLTSLDNVVLTPHLGYVTRNSYQIFFADVVEDIVAWQHGAPIRTDNF